MTTQNISIPVLKEALSNGTATLVDVRAPIEFRSAHVPESMNIPLHRISRQRIEEAFGGKVTTPVYLICTAGVRAQKAADKLAKVHGEA